MGNFFCGLLDPRARLLRALQVGDVNGVRSVLRSAPQVDVCSPEPETQLAPLLLAKWVEHPSKVVVLAKLLLQAGADVDARTPKGETALYGTRNVELVQLLLASGIDVSNRDNQGGTALHSLAAWGATRCVAAVLGAGAEVDAVDDLGQTALHRAANGLHVGALALLMEAGANPDHPDQYGVVPMLLARQAAASSASPALLEQIEKILAGMPIDEALAQSYADGAVLHYSEVREFVDGGLEQLPRGNCWACGPSSVCPGYEHGGAMGCVLGGDLFFPCEMCSDGTEAILVRIQLATGLLSSEFVVIHDRRFVNARWDADKAALVIEGEFRLTEVPQADLPQFVPFRDAGQAQPSHVALAVDDSPVPEGGGSADLERPRTPPSGSDDDDDDSDGEGGHGGMSTFMMAIGGSPERGATQSAWSDSPDSDPRRAFGEEKV